MEMAKFYDKVDLYCLVEDGLQHEYPLGLLIRGIEYYVGPRVVAKRGAMATGCRVGNGIIPGCG